MAGHGNLRQLRDRGGNVVLAAAREAQFQVQGVGHAEGDLLLIDAPGGEDVRAGNYEPGSPTEEHTMLIGRSRDLLQHGDNRIAFRHGEDRLVLNTEDLTGVMNRLLSLHRFYSDWEEQCRQTISRGQSLQSLLDLGENVLGAPLLIVDASQYLLAHSSGLSNSGNTEEMRAG